MTSHEMGGGSIDETVRKRFETAWLDGRPEPIERFLPPERDPAYLPTLEGLVGIDLDFAWKSWSKERQEAATAVLGKRARAVIFYPFLRERPRPSGRGGRAYRPQGRLFFG